MGKQIVSKLAGSTLILILGFFLHGGSLYAQTNVTTNSGDQSIGSLGWAVTTLNSAGAGAISIDSSIGPITLTQPLAQVSQSVTFQGTGAGVIGQDNAQSQFLFQQGFTLDSGAALTLTNNGALSSGLDAAITAASWSLTTNSAFSLSGGNSQAGVVGGAALVTLGASTTGAGSSFLFLGGAGGAGVAGGDGGAAAVSITSLVMSNANGSVAGGRGGNGSFQSGAGGKASLSVGSLSLDTAAALNLTGGSGGVSTGGLGAGGNSQLTANSVSLTGTSTLLNITAGSGGSPQAAISGPINGGNGGSAAVTSSSLSVDSRALMTVTGGTGGTAFASGFGQGGTGGGVTVSLGSLSLTNQGSLGITAGAGGAGGGSSGGTGGTAFVTVGAVTQGTGSSLYIVSGDGGGSASGGSAGAGTVNFLIGSQTLATGATFIAAGGSGGSGTTTGGNGGAVQASAQAVTLANGSTWEAFGGAAGTGTSANGSGGGVFAFLHDLEGSGSVSLGGQGQLTLQVSRGNFSGDISGTEGLNVSGFGTLTLTGNNTYSGGTNISSGTLAVGTDTNMGTGSLTLDNGTLQINELLGNPFSTSKAVSLSPNGGAIYVNGTNNANMMNGIISGTGGLVLNGTGNLILTALNTYTGPTTVLSGTLFMGDLSHPAAQIAGPVTVDTAGNLLGFGSILGAVDNNGTVRGGTLQTIGTLTAGSYNQTAGGTLSADVSPTQSSLLNVSTGATLDGTLTVNQDPGSYGVRYRYILLSAESVTGSFAATLFNTLQYWDPTLTYGPAAVTFILTRNNADFTIWAAGINQKALANNLNGLVTTGSDAFVNKLNELYLLPSGQGALLGRLTGDIYTAIPTIMLDNLQFEDSRLFDRLMAGPLSVSSQAVTGMTGAQAGSMYSPQAGLVRGILAAEISSATGNAAGLASPGIKGLWVESTDSTGSVQASADVSGFSKSNFGFLGGYDRELSPGLTAGVMGGYLHTDITSTDSTSKTGVDDIQFGVYGSMKFSDFELGAVAGYGINHLKVSRAISLGSDANQIVGVFDGSQLQLAVQADYPLNISGITLKPLAGVQFADFTSNSVTETGSDTLALAVPNQGYASLKPYIGLDGSKPINLDEDLKLLPRANLSVSGEMLTNPTQIPTHFTGAPDSTFAVTGISPAALVFGLGAGLDLAFGKQFNFFADYRGHFSGTQNLNTFSGGLNIAF